MGSKITFLQFNFLYSGFFFYYLSFSMMHIKLAIQDLPF